MKAILTVTMSVLALVSNLSAEVVIETVPVGNPGNPGEWAGQSVPIQGTLMGSGNDRICGFVPYPFEIGKYEVTVLQYVEFLNAVAANDPYNLADGSGMACNITRNGVAGSYTYAIGDGSPQAINHWGHRPVASISWADAARFANWMENGQPTGLLTGDGAQDAWLTEDGTYPVLGAPTIGPNVNQAYQPVVRRPGATWVIPSEDEWYKAAYHRNDGVTSNYNTFPTNYSGGLLFGTPDNNVIDPDPGNSANYHIGNPDDDCIGPPFNRTQVGEFENSPSPYGTFDQGGNIWEWTDTRYLNATGGLTLRRIIRGGSYYPSVVQQQPDGFKCMHAAWREDQPPVAGVGRYGFRLAKVNNDCNNNDIVDQEEIANGSAHDYNFNGVLDSCDIAAGASQDCNENGIPDEAEVGDVTPIPYFVDDGVPGGLLSAIGYLGSETEGYMAWMNQFSIEAGRETIGGILPACLSDNVPTGTPMTVYLWSDPNGDGNPSDAAVLASAGAVMSPTLTVVDIPDTTVGPTGTKFFAGVVIHITDVDNTYPASFDDSSDRRASWWAWGPNPIDPNNLVAVGNLCNLHEPSCFGGGGNFMVRALPALGVAQLADVNENGIPDVCEQAGCATEQGDLDADNDVDGKDIQGFVTCHLQGPGVPAGCQCADMNTPNPDGIQNGVDITLFVSRLLSP